jgi:hypothetical protein
MVGLVPGFVHPAACGHAVVSEPAPELVADDVPVGIQYITPSGLP